MMSLREEMLDKVDYYRGNELSAGSIEVPSSKEESPVSQTRSAVEGSNGEDDMISKEREAELELWMENVKAFIRQIDVSRL
jgi:hypothetical protein